MRNRLEIKVNAPGAALIDSEGAYEEQAAGNLLTQAVLELQSLGLMLTPVRSHEGENLRMTVFQRQPVKGILGMSSKALWTDVGFIAISPVE